MHILDTRIAKSGLKTDFFQCILRTLVGIIDDYFDGCYTEEMIESQVFNFVTFLFFDAIPCFLANSLVSFKFSVYLYVNQQADIAVFLKGFCQFTTCDSNFFYFHRLINLYLKS